MTVLETLSVTILYGQLLVFTPSAAYPGLLWTDDHVAQGFAWTQESVSFGIPDHDGDCLVRIALRDEPIKRPGTLWSVKVPLKVTEAAVEIGSIISETRIAIPNGSYDLVFTAQQADDPEFAFLISIDFIASPDPGFAILEQGTELATDIVLRRDAEPALLVGTP